MDLTFISSIPSWVLPSLLVLFASNCVLARLWWLARREARFDSLTGALSRKAGLAHLNPSKRAAHFDALLLMIDLDSLKRINTELGHAYGDHVLKRLVSGVQGHLKHGEWICRYGGDEFLVLWKCSALEACERVDKIKAQLSPDLSFSVEFTNLKTDVSAEDLIQRLSLGLGIQKSKASNLDSTLSGLVPQGIQLNSWSRKNVQADRL